MKILNLYPIDHVDHLVTPDEFEQIGLSSSALTIFTDFMQHRPLVLDGSTSVAEAESMMRKAHVKMKLVVDVKMEFIGIISLEDLTGPKVLKRVAEGHLRQDIDVSDVMRRRDELQALDYGEVARASVADVVETLKENGLQHCLVVQRSEHQIRGLISAADIARKLHIELDVSRPTSFAELFSRIHFDAA